MESLIMINFIKEELHPFNFFKIIYLTSIALFFLMMYLMFIGYVIPDLPWWTNKM